MTAQGIGLALLIAVRARKGGVLPLSVLQQSWRAGWSRIIRLGLPLCLSFIGIAVSASVVMLALRLQAGEDHGALVAGYGVVTRLLGFAFLPQMAIALATQSISGNNAGAGRPDRAQAALRLAMAAGFLWCLLVALIGLVGAHALAGWFSDDPAVTAAVAQILRPMMLVYAASGPVLVLALHFQALGQPGRTAALTLVKPWLLSPALVMLLSTTFGVPGIWLAFPVADAVILALVVGVGRDAFLQVRGQA